MKCCQKFETCGSVRILYEFLGNNVTEEQNFVKKKLWTKSILVLVYDLLYILFIIGGILRNLQKDIEISS